MNGQRPRLALSFPEIPPTTRLDRDHARYPRDLTDLGADEPPYLWARGSLDLLDIRPRVAIVGTRRSTAYGRRVTHELATALARAGACIVSGLARGIDAFAHTAALEAGGATIAVLGTGIDVVYPKGHRELQETISRRGLLLTELESTEPGMSWTFPKRNRIIAAISDATIVVEAPDQSGALITAEHALNLGRSVGGIPGQIDQPQSEGVNRLIRDGAVLLPSIEDGLALAGLTPPPRTPRVDPDGDEGRVWGALSSGPLAIDALCHHSGLPAAQCMVAVTNLEIAGSIECLLTGEIRRR